MPRLSSHIAFTVEPQEYVKIEEQAQVEGRSFASMVRVLVRLGYRRRIAESTPTNPEPLQATTPTPPR